MKGVAAVPNSAVEHAADGVAAAYGRPALLTSFIGREDEIAAIAGLFRSGHRLVTITGPGGVGKTRLALAVAAALSGSPGLVQEEVFVTLAPVADEALVIPTIARALGVVAEDERAPVERLAAGLRGRRLLLTLDNLEHVFGAAPALGVLLQRCPDLAILATSRRALKLAGEQEFPLAPLVAPGSGTPLALAELAATPAVALFLARAAAANPAFTLTGANAAAVAEICHRLDGLPLAIELAAARVKLLSPSALAARLTGRFQLLTSGPRDVPRRQQTLRDAIAWSYDLLTGGEQALFRRLALFAGGATLEAIASEIITENGSDALDMIAALIDHSLLIQEEGVDGEPRFRMLETIREYGLERLEAAGEAGAARDAHASYFLGLAERAAGTEYDREEGARFRRLEPEHDNVRAALHWLLHKQGFGSERAQLGLRLAGAMVRFWDVRGYLREEADWLERALALVPEGPTRERATALTALGVNAWFVGDLDRAVARQEQALAIWRALDDRSAIVRSLWFLGLVAGKRGDVARLEALSAECAPLAPGLGVTLWKVVPDSLLGLAALAAGDGKQVHELLQPTLPYHEQHGFLWPHAWVLGVLAEAAMLEGDRVRALALHQQSLAEFAEHGDVYAMLDGLTAIALHATSFGQAEIAARLLGAVATTRAAVGRRVTWVSVTEEEAARSVREVLGSVDFETAYGAGRAQPLTDAVALALTVEPAPSTGVGSLPPGGDTQLLSPRERQVLRLVVEGKSNQRIGEALFISPRTAGTHVSNILAKLSVATRAEAAARAVGGGLV